MSQENLFWNSIKKNSERVDYDFKGKKNKTHFPEFIKLCKLGQAKLKEYLIDWANEKYAGVNEKGVGVAGNGYVYIRGNIPILLTAHMDTVHKELVKDFYEYKGDIISSPQGIGGDDRCGIYMIQRIVETTKLRPYILFCEDEEIGGVGSDKFCITEYADELENMLFLVELDRAHANDLVYYDDENEEFHKFCEEVTGYKEAYGSFSDISNLSPQCRVSSVNISCGYYNAHTTSEYVVMSEMENSIKATIKLIEVGVSKGKQFEYEDTSKYNFDNYYGFGYRNNFPAKHSDEIKDWYFYTDEYTDELFAQGRSLEEAVGELLISNPELRWGDIIDYYEC